MQCNIFKDDSADYREFIEAGFVINKQRNEFNEIQLFNAEVKRKEKALSITIIPTMDCNFGCIYCYQGEHEKDTIMNEEIKDKMISFIKAHKDISILEVCWYGGEPLLELDTIKDISRKLISYCDENNIKYNASMVSNAFLLSRTTAELLKHLRINTIQITIDGIAETHDVYRPLLNSQPTWERIIKNLEQAISILGGISIRCNVDKRNISSVYKLADYLYESDILHKTHFYIGKIDGSEYYNSEILFSNYEFSLVEFQFKKYLFTKYQYGTLLPKQKFVACSACAYNHYVINYNGDIYQCLNDIGDTEKMLSNILSENLMKDLIYSRNYQKYILNDFFHDKNCKECQFLPACMGGCPHDREVNDYGSCKGLKDILPQIIQTTMEEKGGYHEVSS